LGSLKRLAGQTAIYGVGTILPRVLNYLLTPLYTTLFAPGVFAVFNEGYAYTAILLVILTYGMETALFHFCTREENRQKVFSTAMTAILFTSGAFWILVFLFSGQLANLMRYPGHEEYVYWLGLIVGLDAISAIPLAWLRQLNRPKTFTAITLTNIIINIGLNLFFLVYCRHQYIATDGNPSGLVKLLYNPAIGVGYVFISNLVASFIKTLLCLPFFFRQKWEFDKELLRRMLSYSWPLLIAGLGFIINERLDLIMLKFLLPLPHDEAMKQVGIYSGCYKLAILMSIFIQAYRYAAEPFFFGQQKEKDSRKVYARIMNYFVILCCLIFLLVNLYIDVFKHFIRNEQYWEGLRIVPIIMLANLFLGIYINLSMWYKLSGHTLFGAWFSLLGAAITIGLNVWLIPRYGYMASAWTTFVAYFAMMMASYIAGQKHYPIPYNIRKLILYLAVSAFLYFLSTRLHIRNEVLRIVVNTFFFLPFFFVVYQVEKPVRNFVNATVNRYGSKSKHRK